MRKLAFMAGGLVVVGAAGLVAWRRNPRIGTRFMNEVLNPVLVARGIAGAGRSELGTLEHVGRRTGTRHLTPIHPVAIDDGYRIVVPLGERSEWAHNVVAAGHCRMQLHDIVYELDEPALLAAGEMGDIPAPVAWILDGLGVRYLLLRRFGDAPGRLDPSEEDARSAELERDEPAAATTG